MLSVLLPKVGERVKLTQVFKPTFGGAPVPCEWPIGAAGTVMTVTDTAIVVDMDWTGEDEGL